MLPGFSFLPFLTLQQYRIRYSPRAVFHLTLSAASAALLRLDISNPVSLMDVASCQLQRILHHFSKGATAGPVQVAAGLFKGDTSHLLLVHRGGVLLLPSF